MPRQAEHDKLSCGTAVGHRGQTSATNAHTERGGGASTVGKRKQAQRPGGLLVTLKIWTNASRRRRQPRPHSSEEGVLRSMYISVKPSHERLASTQPVARSSLFLYPLLSLKNFPLLTPVSIPLSRTFPLKSCSKGPCPVTSSWAKHPDTPSIASRPCLISAICTFSHSSLSTGFANPPKSPSSPGALST